MGQAIKPGRLALFVALCLLLLASAYFVYHEAISKGGIKRGLDIAGGLRVTFQAVETGEEEVDADAIERAVSIIRRRVDELGVSEPRITPQGGNRILVELPALQNVEQAREIIGRTARLSFVGPDGVEIVTGKNLRRARVERNPAVSPYPYVSLEFDEEGGELFYEATGRFLGEPIAIKLDDKVISAPVVQAIIPGGQAKIEGDFTFEEASNLALLLRSGALPVVLEEIESYLIGPTLGQRTLAISIYAAAAGLAGVILFMLFYYRFAGLIAGVALVAYLTLVLGVLTLLPTTLTVPGIAALVLSIGMAVDANVIIFERIKDELRLGRTVRTAMESGFERAFRAILDANVTTIIAAVILVAINKPGNPVLSFGVNLFIGVVCSMVTAIVLTRFLLRLAFRAGILRSGAYLVGVKRS